MLGMAIMFAILALIAGVLGFVTLAGSLAVIAKVLLFVFLALFVISLIFGRGRGGVSLILGEVSGLPHLGPPIRPEPWWASRRSTESASPFRRRSREAENRPDSVMRVQTVQS